MAFPSKVDPKVTDAVTSANVAVLGAAPATAMGNLYIATSSALAAAAHNASNAQDQNNRIAQASTTMGVALLTSLQALEVAWINKLKPKAG
jgi:hypothetical protein